MLILTSVKSDRRRKSQKTIVTIAFITLILCRVQNFIKIEAFVALRPKLPKLWPNRWQVHRMTSVNIDRCQKLEKKYCHHWIHRPRLCRVRNFFKIDAFATLRPKLWPQRWQCEHWQVSRITKKYCHWWIQHLQIVHYAKFRRKCLTSFPVPCYPFLVPLFKDSLF